MVTTSSPHPSPPPPFSATRGVWSGLCSRAGCARWLSQHERLPAKLSRDLDAFFQQEFAEVEVMMRDLRSAIGKTPAPTPDTGIAATPVQGLRVWAKLTPVPVEHHALQHGGIPPRSQIHDGANLKKSQEQA